MNRKIPKLTDEQQKLFAAAQPFSVLNNNERSMLENRIDEALACCCSAPDAYVIIILAQGSRYTPLDVYKRIERRIPSFVERTGITVATQEIRASTDVRFDLCIYPDKRIARVEIIKAGHPDRMRGISPSAVFLDECPPHKIDSETERVARQSLNRRIGADKNPRPFSV